MELALRVTPAGTWLTVHRRLSVRSLKIKKLNILIHSLLIILKFDNFPNVTDATVAQP